MDFQNRAAELVANSYGNRLSGYCMGFDWCETVVVIRYSVQEK